MVRPRAAGGGRDGRDVRAVAAVLVHRRRARGGRWLTPWCSPATGTAEAVADLLDRVVHRGAVVTGDVIISLAGINLVRLDLRLLLLGIEG
ncbi:gas vesicle protein [Amycolatopsis sp. NPDC051758]|uniref:gas vesicle protein n=1 Tax=Amycolatopsis sp. NPDC051758 TaxID=3363935 RepID=UPI0037ADA109